MRTSVVIEDGRMTLKLIPENEFETKVIEMFDRKEVEVHKSYRNMDVMHSVDRRRELSILIREMTPEEVEIQHRFKEWLESKAEPDMVSGD